MDMFYLVCAWDGYYPEGGLRNIILCTHDEDEAYEFQRDCIQRGIPSPYDKTDTVTRYKRDFVKVYDSSDLPWSDVTDTAE